MNWQQEMQKNPLYKEKGLVGENGLSMLYPLFREKVARIQQKCIELKLPHRIFETFRSSERQAYLYSQGRTKLQKNGMHFFGVATDFVPKIDGKGWTWQVNGDLWIAFGKVVKAEGLIWGGDFKSFKDYPHVQLIPATSAEQGKIIKGIYP